MDHLAGLQAHRTEGRSLIEIDLGARFFGEFTCGRFEGIFTRFEEPLGDRPGTFVLVPPIRASRVSKQHFDATGTHSKEQHTRRLLLAHPRRWASQHVTPSGPTVAACGVIASISSLSPGASATSPDSKWKTIDPRTQYRTLL